MQLDCWDCEFLNAVSFYYFYAICSTLSCRFLAHAVNLGEEDQDAYDINKLKKPVNGNIPGMNGKTLSEADTLLVRGKMHCVLVISELLAVVLKI